MTDLAHVEQELGEAIGAVLTRHGMMPNRWLLVGEVLEVDGERALATFASPDCRAWDSYGLLTYALVREKALQHKEVLEEDR